MHENNAIVFKANRKKIGTGSTPMMWFVIILADGSSQKVDLQAK
jgi:hypothetical protein